MTSLFVHWDVDRVAFTIPWVGKEIPWYALAFVAGFALGLWIVGKVWKHEKLKEEWLDSLFFYVFFATIIGARLGHVLFYDLQNYLANPIEIFKVWKGGLASHGGTLGIIIAVWIYSKRVTHKNMLWTFDRLALPIGFVAALIRIGNLMNSEIFGHPTTLPWGFQFVRAYEYRHLIDVPACHPTQIYEAIFYTITSIICLWMYWKKDAHKQQGLILGVFFIGIFLSRFFIEFFKNNQEVFEEGMFLNMGQLLSIPFVLAGIWLTYKGLQERRKSKNVAVKTNSAQVFERKETKAQKK